MNQYALTRQFRWLRDETLDRRVRERLAVRAEGSNGNVMIHLDFNARLVTALREEKLWPCALEGREEHLDG